MKYQVTGIIPHERRADINQKILSIIQSNDLQTLTMDDIYSGYTGIGGLHGLQLKDFKNRHEYTEAKKDMEQGQFFTPAFFIHQLSAMVNPLDFETMCDPTCGAGAWFNFFKEENCYGCEIDERAARVARFLYPEAHIETRDIRYYHPGIKFDYIWGNPPFNIRWDIDGETYNSQLYFFMKSAELMKPGALLLCIVPETFMMDLFQDKWAIEPINKLFNFAFQYKLPEDAFKSLGVESFGTKVMCFQRQAESLPVRDYTTDMVDQDEAAEILKAIQEERHKLRIKLQAEFIKSMGDNDFGYRVRKFLYEIKTHKPLKPFFPKAEAYVTLYKNQKQPATMNDAEWEKTRITEKKVLAYLKRIMRRQSAPEPKDEYKLVKNSYGLHYKGYSKKAEHRMRKELGATRWTFNDLVVSNGKDLASFPKGFQRLIRRKKRNYDLQTTAWKDMGRSADIDALLNRFVFYNPKGEKCRFNNFQKNDLGLILQKDAGILNWQQGSGKTPGAAAWIRWNKDLRNIFIIGPAVAINMTWVNFMALHKKDYVNIRSMADVAEIKPGKFVLISLDFLTKYQRHIKKYIKGQGNKVGVVFDESDEITNNSALRTKAVRSCFVRAKKKLLATGTTTRNNITELYSQLELLYNNSVNMLCHCEEYWVSEYDKADQEWILVKESNEYYNLPFPPKAGALLFKRCFNPERSTVFGIKKHNQDLHHQGELRKIIEYSIITRKFREIAGDKYFITHKQVIQSPEEKELYKVVMNEFYTICGNYFTSTGNSRKDAGLRLVRQMQLLIKATSVPQVFKEYTGDNINNKAKGIFEELDEHADKKVAIGCTSIEGVDYYCRIVGERYPFRPVTKIIGEVNFTKRSKLVKEFEGTANGILICTQQSLRSSVNIPTCDWVIIESMQWNIPKMEQFFFRFIRYDSKNMTGVRFINYKGTIEANLLALLMNKERLNDFIKTLEYVDDSDIYDEYGVDLDILNEIITKDYDEDGKVRVSWGKAKEVTAADVVDKPVKEVV